MRTIDVVAARNDEGQVEGAVVRLGYEFGTCLGRSVWVGGLEGREKREKAASETESVDVRGGWIVYSKQSLTNPFPLLPSLPLPSYTYLEHLIFKHGFLVHCSLSVHLIRRDMHKPHDSMELGTL